MKKTLLSVLFASIIFMSQMSVAQIHVDSEGRVGIGTNTIDTSTKLKITSDGINNDQDNKYVYVKYTGTNTNRNHYGFYSDIAPSSNGYGFGAYLNGGRVGLQSQAMLSGTGYRYGLLSYAYNGATENRAIHAVANGNGVANQKCYGVHTRALGTSDYNCALYAEASGALYGNNWAGVFNGRVSMTNTIEYSSDEKLKENIKDIENAIEKIKKIKSKTYKYKKNKNLTNDEDLHYGFIAQDLEQVFPELVSDITIFSTNDPELENEKDINKEKTNESIKSIKYMEIIPILVQGLQEQQSTIEDLLDRLNKLENKQ
ncbi:MAG: tail fiber domain-containing protein [Melioribacteraceae bacterium]